MTQKTLLITGCSSGIGYDAAHGMKARGWRVFATCRKPEDCARLEAEGLESFPLDQTDPESIRTALAEATTRTGGLLDAIFANGAFGLPAAAEDLPTDALREIFETNFFGIHELARQVIPILRAQGGGRLVLNSSVLGFAAFRWRAAYTATKFAMEGWADTLRLEMQGTGIDVVLIEPGPVTSDLRRKSRPHFERWIDWQASLRRALYEETILPRLYDETNTPDRFELPASAVTAKLAHALEARRPKARYWVTTPTYIAGILTRLLPTRMIDRILMRL
ncbi:MAG TPA: SDR family NAD(P)-dependent oxidoreductase [Rhodobacterales bacterium]|nr:SDR family NAD(P)-dependent oxidoreductase [Rhodobacterales bacterium]